MFEAIESELAKLRDVDSQKLNVVRRRDKDTYEAIMWLRQHRDDFEDAIYEPPMMTVCLLYYPAFHHYHAHRECSSTELFALIALMIPFLFFTVYICGIYVAITSISSTKYFFVTSSAHSIVVFFKPISETLPAIYTFLAQCD